MDKQCWLLIKHNNQTWQMYTFPKNVPYSLPHLGIFVPLRDVKCKYHIITKPKTCSVCKFQMTISDRTKDMEVYRMARYIEKTLKL